jgi:hypothetical protein
MSFYIFDKFYLSFMRFYDTKKKSSLSIHPRTTPHLPLTTPRNSTMRTVCEVCTSAPASRMCVADDALLCGTCDDRRVPFCETREKIDEP